MRPVRPDRDPPSLPVMLLFGVALILGSVARLVAEAAVRAIAPGKADPE